MKRVVLVLIAGATLVACSTDNDIVRGGAIGAAGGAVAGAVVPGVSAGEGALAGAAIGAVAGALDKDRDRERTAAGYRGAGWSEIDGSVRNDMALQDRVMARYDTNRNHELDRSEGEVAARDLRRLMDTDGNGNISREEYDRNRDYALRNIG